MDGHTSMTSDTERKDAGLVTITLQERLESVHRLRREVCMAESKCGRMYLMNLREPLEDLLQGTQLGDHRLLQEERQL